MTDILLINAPIDFPRMAKGVTIPLGLAYIASYLISKDINVKTIDLEVEDISKDICKLIKKESPSIVGISCNTHTRYKAFEIVDKIKNEFPNLHITMGGPHVSFTAENVLRNTKADSVVRGEGEYTIYELFEAIEKNNGFENIKGISYKNQKCKIIHNESREPIKDLDLLPFPDRNSFNISKYELIFPGKNKKELSGHLITSRGCPFNCIFCSASAFSNKRARYRSPSNVVDEIEYLVDELSYKNIYIYDDHFTVSSKRVVEICDEIRKRNLDANFFCYSRIDSVTKEKFKKMAEAGFNVVSFGIESGSQKILDYLRKGIKIEQIIKAVRICKDVNITVKATFIVGSPGERILDFKKTCKLINKLYTIQPKFLPTIGFNGIFIYPGTEIYKIALQNGILPKNFDWTKKYNDLSYFLNVPIYMTKEVKRLLLKAPKIYKFYIAKRLTTHLNQLFRYMKDIIPKDV